MDTIEGRMLPIIETRRAKVPIVDRLALFLTGAVFGTVLTFVVGAGSLWIGTPR